MYLSLRFPVPLPVEFGPHEADWWMVWVTGASAFISLAIAIVAITGARQARGIAKQSEAERLETENRRERFAYESRLDDALANLFQAIAEHFGPLKQWMDRAELVEERGYTDNFGDLDYPPNPDMDHVEAQAEVVRMIARGEDADVARELAFGITLTSNASGRRRWLQLKGLMQAIREWRSGAANTLDTLAYLKRFQDENAPKD